MKSLEDQKKKLEERIKSEADKAISYEVMARKIAEEREEERRKTLLDNETIMRNLEKARQ